MENISKISIQREKKLLQKSFENWKEKTLNMGEKESILEEKHETLILKKQFQVTE